jgi:hypothetical protein
MPRDGSGIYTKPFPDVVTGTTIQSTVHNGTISDVAQDLNAPRPIVSGGTGANNARDAMTSLQGDVAYQVVTNYDVYAFVSGSFYSAAGATSAPTANAFIGQCYTSDPAVVPPAVPAGQNMFIEARDVTTGLKYVRQKVAGVWINSGAWKQQPGSTTDLDAAYVNVSGDTMTGTLTAAGALVSTGYVMAQNSNYYFNAAATKYLMYDGVNFNLVGGKLITPQVICNDNIVSVLSSSTGGYYFGNSGTKYLNYDGAQFNFVGGTVSAANVVSLGDVYVGFGSAGTVLRFGNAPGSHYLQYDGVANYNLAGGSLIVGGTQINSGSVVSSVHWAGPASQGKGMMDGSANLLFQTAASGNHYFQSNGGAANWFSIGATGATVWGGNLYLNSTANTGVTFTGNLNFVLAGVTIAYCRSDNLFLSNVAAYKPGGGPWADSSDSRIKNVEGEYTRGLDEVVGLRPVYFTFKGNETDTAPEAGKDAQGNELPVAVPYANSAHAISAKSATKYTGLIAQEVEAIFPEMVTRRAAYIDGQPVNDLRDLDTAPLIFALINAVKQLKARVEQLEAT